MFFIFNFPNFQTLVQILEALLQPVVLFFYNEAIDKSY